MFQFHYRILSFFSAWSFWQISITVYWSTNIAWIVYIHMMLMLILLPLSSNRSMLEWGAVSCTSFTLSRKFWINHFHFHVVCVGEAVCTSNGERAWAAMVHDSHNSLLAFTTGLIWCCEGIGSSIRYSLPTNITYTTERQGQGGLMLTKGEGWWNPPKACVYSFYEHGDSVTIQIRTKPIVYIPTSSRDSLVSCSVSFHHVLYPLERLLYPIAFSILATIVTRDTYYSST